MGTLSEEKSVRVVWRTRLKEEIGDQTCDRCGAPVDRSIEGRDPIDVQVVADYFPPKRVAWIS
jgi:hypothetical protein